MRHVARLVTPMVLLLLTAAADLRADEAEIQKFLRDYVDAFNRQDLDALSAMWSETCTHVDRQSGQRTEGRAAIRADLSEALKNPAKSRIEGTVDRIELLKPDRASVEGTTTTSAPDQQPSISQFSAILVKHGDGWQIDSVEEMPKPQPSTAYEALQDLAWLEGAWLDDSKDSPVVSTFRWSPTGSFLIRSFSTKDGDAATQLGTQIIGWDPRSQQIRSWTFNADGSFGDGVWAKSGSDWSIKSTQTLADGRAASGTYVISPVDKNTVTLRLVGQEVEGEPAPASEPISLRRVADSGTRAQQEPKPAK